MSKTQDAAKYGHLNPVPKNLIINGGMGVAQRGTSIVAPANTDYTLDRWQWTQVGTGVVTVTQSASQSGASPHWHALYVDVTTADASLAATDIYLMRQRIEGRTLTDSGWGGASAKDITLSFKTAHTKTGTYCVAFRNSALNRSYIAEYTQSVASSWETHEITIPGDTTGTWLRSADTGIEINFVIGASATSNWVGTADAWTATNDLHTANQVSVMDSTSGFFRFTDVNLVYGDVAIPFEARPFADELLLCQRYFEKSFLYTTKPAEGVAGGGGGVGVAATTTNIYCNEVTFKATKRAVPTMTFYRGSNGTTAGRWASWLSGTWTTGTLATTTQHRNEFAFTPRLDGLTVTLGGGYLVQGYWTAEAELM